MFAFARTSGKGSPAHAGIDPAVHERGGNRNGFPRTRGDRPKDHYTALVYQKVPPHTRG